MDNPLVSNYLTEIRRSGRIDRETEISLASRARDGCRASRDELVLANLGFVVGVAREYRNLGLPLEDLMNEGMVGLLEASERFDPERGTKFITFAIWWIRKAILAALGRANGVVRVPGYQRRLLQDLRRVEATLRQQLGRDPTVEEVAARASTTPERVDRVLRLEKFEVSLDHRVGQNGDGTVVDLLPDDTADSPETTVIDREIVDRLVEEMKGLREREARVLAERLGLGDEPPRTLSEVGERLGLSRERVRQIEVEAKERLKRAVRRREAGQTRSARGRSA